jgi:proline dehydrogenase
MPLLRSMLLAASQNVWLREHAVNYPFVRRSVSRFMPGETLDDALRAAEALRQKKIVAVFTHLGENVADRQEAQNVTQHYLHALERLHASGLGIEISIKLTQLGLDLSPDFCLDNVLRILQAEKPDSIVWIDMEASHYVDPTLDIYRRALKQFPNTGICMQAYLRRTKKDLADLLPLRPSIRLVKGAYCEPPEIAFPSKSDVDDNYFHLAVDMLHSQHGKECRRAAFGTHDGILIRRLAEYCKSQSFANSELEVQMLYGIQRAEQERLANEGCRSGVLVAYGTYWYPWFVRRLAERPANLWFMMRNVFAA